MLSRRDFLSARFKSQHEEEHVKTEGDIKEGFCLEDIQTIGSDFTEDMLYTEMMRMGKDPSNMSVDQMLSEVLNLMKTE